MSHGDIIDLMWRSAAIGFIFGINVPGLISLISDLFGSSK